MYEFYNGDVLTIKQDSVVIGTSIKLANKWYSRLKGLLGSTKLSINTGLWLSPCNSIHMIGMLYSIDAIFLDKDNKVCKLVNNLPPFFMSYGGKMAHSVIELPANCLKDKNIKIGYPISVEKN